jgi:hypothetical protein
MTVGVHNTVFSFIFLECRPRSSGRRPEDTANLAHPSKAGFDRVRIFS